MVESKCGFYNMEVKTIVKSFESYLFSERSFWATRTLSKKPLKKNFLTAYYLFQILQSQDSLTTIGDSWQHYYLFLILQSQNSLLITIGRL